MEHDTAIRLLLLLVLIYKDWQILRQCRRRGHAINHSLHIITGL
jgi:hypothetical protein